MKLALLVVGRTAQKEYITLINDYIKRLQHTQLPLEIRVIPELKSTKNLSQSQQKEKEGALILKAIRPGDHIVLLDEHGKTFRSMEFSNYLEKKMNVVSKQMVCVIGGPYGFSSAVYEAAHDKISLSKMTLSHQMIRLLFVEQVYRAMTILQGGPYHHE